VRSVLATTYARVELVVVDDHSSDDTAAVARAAAGGDPRARVVANAPLPAGWFGKQWACATGAAEARGDVLLFADADTVHAPDLVPRAVAALRRRGGGLLSVVGRQEMGTFWERLMQPQVLAILLGRFGGTERVGRSRRVVDKIANGQCLLIDRATYDAVGGHAVVRDVVAEDLALAQRTFAAGFPVHLVLGEQQLATRMYTSLPELMRGWRKNVFAGGREAMPLGTLGRLLFPLLLLLPPLLGLLPAVGLLLALAGVVPAGRRARRRRRADRVARILGGHVPADGRRRPLRARGAARRRGAARHRRPGDRPRPARRVARPRVRVRRTDRLLARPRPRVRDARPRAVPRGRPAGEGRTVDHRGPNGGHPDPLRDRATRAPRSVSPGRTSTRHCYPSQCTLAYGCRTSSRPTLCTIPDAHRDRRQATPPERIACPASLRHRRGRRWPLARCTARRAARRTGRRRARRCSTRSGRSGERSACRAAARSSGRAFTPRSSTRSGSSRRPARSLSELAERTHTDPSSVSVVVQRLVERGLVTRTAAPDDRRRTELAATAAGRALLRRAPQSPTRRLERALESIGEQEAAALARKLAALAAALDGEGQTA
jgi:chlorobactene glucosyltransferase